MPRLGPAHLLAAAVAAVLASLALPTPFLTTERQLGQGVLAANSSATLHVVGSEAAYGATLSLLVRCHGAVKVSVTVSDDVRASGRCERGSLALNTSLGPADAGGEVVLAVTGVGYVAYSAWLSYRVPTVSLPKLGLLAAAVALASAAAWLSVRRLSQP